MESISAISSRKIPLAVKIGILILLLTSLFFTVAKPVRAQALSADRANCAIRVDDLPTARTVLSIPNLTRPALGQSAIDPAHGSCITRLTDHTATPGISYLRHVYSRSQTFNADNTRMLAVASNGFWHLIDTASAEDLGILPTLAGTAEPQWHVSDPDLLYFLPTNGGLNIQQLNVVSGEISVVVDFSGRLPWPQAARVWTRAEGSPSVDQRFWAFIVETDNFTELGMIVWDRLNDSIVGTFDFAEQGVTKPDHVSMSPTGEYVVASWFPPQGTVAYTRDFSRQVKLANTTEHSDIALLPGNRDAFVSINYQSSRGNVYYTDITQAMETGEANQIALYTTFLNGSSNSLHVSGKSFERPGWALISVYGERHNVSPDQLTRQWHDDRVFAIELKPEGRVINLAHHRSDVLDDYWQEPHATVNRDFTAVVFASDWGNNGALDVDSYLIDGLQWNDNPPSNQVCDVSDPALQITTRSGIWSLLSLPCKPADGAGIAELFGDDVPGVLQQDWTAYVYDPATNIYTEATADTELSQGEGFWFIQASGTNRTLDLPTGSTRWSDTSAVTGCSGDEGCVTVSLDSSLTPSPWQIIGNPLVTPTPVNSITFTAPAGPCSTGTGCNFTQATAVTAQLVRPPMWRFDDDAATPGYEPIGAGDVIGLWDGLWIELNDGAENNAPQLHFPQPD
ncbi:MAG: hypothetical protein AB8B97_04705 [Granulosicoccus sp.]